MSFRGPDEGFLQKKRFFRVMPALDHGAKAKIINKLNLYLLNKPEKLSFFEQLSTDCANYAVYNIFNL